MAFLSGFVIYPALAMMLGPVLGWPATPKIILWAEVFVYSLLLSRWSNTNILSLVFPMAILLGAALWMNVYTGYFLLLLGVLSWVRSGICFNDKPVRAIMAEVVSVAAGVFLIGVWMPSGMLQWVLGIWLFGLVQCLYFYIVGWERQGRGEREAMDSFEQARQELEKILSRQWES
jgi:hypothetical protein